MTYKVSSGTLNLCSLTMSKVVERLVCRKLVAYLNKHGFLSTLQSAYRRFHSTENSVLKLVCDALLAADRGEVTLLGFLDLSAAFDTVEHKILLDRLRQTFGLRGQVLDWILRPWNAVFYSVAADVISIAQRCGFQVYSYTDDTELYFHSKAESCERRLPHFTECIAAIEIRMTANRLKMNIDKIDFIWLGFKHQLAKIKFQSITLEAVHVPVSSVVTCLGVQFDSQLTFIPHVQCLARHCFYRLRQLLSVRRTLTTDSAKALVHALIASRFDYTSIKCCIR